MESLNIVDGIVIVIVLISAILAYARGLTREIMAITVSYTHLRAHET